MAVHRPIIRRRCDTNSGGATALGRAASLEDLVANRPYDIVNLHLGVPTVKGARAKVPAFMVFEVTSEIQEDIEAFLSEVHALVHDAALVLVDTTRL
ncbi:MAG: hypothetical protein U5R31_08605 [Acidimicrobiia bacterium]|nr:hypothetical protein [Acidimicrobiia bacterium]